MEQMPIDWMSSNFCSLISLEHQISLADCCNL